MIKENIIEKIQTKMLHICEERFGTSRCSAVCDTCILKNITDYMLEELEAYY